MVSLAVMRSVVVLLIAVAVLPVPVWVREVPLSGLRPPGDDVGLGVAMPEDGTRSRGDIVTTVVDASKTQQRRVPNAPWTDLATKWLTPVGNCRGRPDLLVTAQVNGDRGRWWTVVEELSHRAKAAIPSAMAGSIDNWTWAMPSAA